MSEARSELRLEREHFGWVARLLDRVFSAQARDSLLFGLVLSGCHMVFLSLPEKLVCRGHKDVEIVAVDILVPDSISDPVLQARVRPIARRLRQMVLLPESAQGPVACVCRQAHAVIELHPGNARIVLLLEHDELGAIGFYRRAETSHERIPCCVLRHHDAVHELIIVIDDLMELLIVIEKLFSFDDFLLHV